MNIIGSSQTKYERLDATKFKSIESIASYLQGQYGFEKFKKIYGKVVIIDGRSRGRIRIGQYVEELEGYLTPSQVDKHLVLFLVLSRLNS